jgi:hypothetical protein
MKQVEARALLAASFMLDCSLVCGSVDGWGTKIQAGKSRVRVPMRLLHFFNIPNPSSWTMVLGFTRILTEISTRRYTNIRDIEHHNVDWSQLAQGMILLWSLVNTVFFTKAQLIFYQLSIYQNIKKHFAKAIGFSVCRSQWQVLRTASCIHVSDLRSSNLRKCAVAPEYEASLRAMLQSDLFSSCFRPVNI